LLVLLMCKNGYLKQKVGENFTISKHWRLFYKKLGYRNWLEMFIKLHKSFQEKIEICSITYFGVSFKEYIEMAKTLGRV